MSAGDEGLRGVVHGKMIQLEKEIGLPDGQAVTVSVRPLATTPRVAGEGLRASAGTGQTTPMGWTPTWKRLAGAGNSTDQGSNHEFSLGHRHLLRASQATRRAHKSYGPTFWATARFRFSQWGNS